MKTTPMRNDDSGNSDALCTNQADKIAAATMPPALVRVVEMPEETMRRVNARGTMPATTMQAALMRVVRTRKRRRGPHQCKQRKYR